MRVAYFLAVWALLLLAAAVGCPPSRELTAAWEHTGVLYSEGRYAEGEVVAREALERAEKESGPEHPYVATSLNNLAGLYQAQGRYAEAEPLRRRDLAISEKALGAEHPDVAASLNNLGATQARAPSSREWPSSIASTSASWPARGPPKGSRIPTRRTWRRRHCWWRSWRGPRMPPMRVARMAARFAPEDDALGRAVREQQDAASRLEAAEGTAKKVSDPRFRAGRG